MRNIWRKEKKAEEFDFMAEFTNQTIQIGELRQFLNQKELIEELNALDKMLAYIWERLTIESNTKI